MVASRTESCKGKAWPVEGKPVWSALWEGAMWVHCWCAALAVATAWCQSCTAEADQVLSERAVFCSLSLMTRVTLVESPPLICNLGKADFSLLKEKSSAGEACGNPCAKGWAWGKADAGVQGATEADPQLGAATEGTPMEPVTPPSCCAGWGGKSRSLAEAFP